MRIGCSSASSRSPKSAAASRYCRGRRRDRLGEWLSRDLPDRFAGRVLAVDLDVAERWGDVMAASQASGATLEPLDAFFAATALAYDLTLATRNVRDFQACGVRLFNPWTIGEA
jgi:predicted nucleic acid-binding protein